MTAGFFVCMDWRISEARRHRGQPHARAPIPGGEFLQEPAQFQAHGIGSGF